MQAITIQIQSILYKNEKDAIEKAIENLANAVLVARGVGKEIGEIVLRYGDASPEPVFTQEEIANLKQEYIGILDIGVTYFNENTGTAKGHNKLAEECHTEYIMIMNPDVIVNPHIFDQLLSPFEKENGNVGITEARQTPIEHHKSYDEDTGETSWASTACALFRTSVFEQVGGFDSESFFMYCDDLDFSWMVRLAGYKVIYVPGAPVFHAKSLTPNAGWQATKSEIYYSAEAALFLAHKWSNPERVSNLLNDFSNSQEEIYKKIAKVFKERQKEGRLPKPIDPEHTVASFTEYGYGEYRYIL